MARTSRRRIAATLPTALPVIALAVSGCGAEGLGGDASESPRGNTVVDVGETVTVTSERGSVTADLTVDSIAVTSSCPNSPLGASTQNGHLVRLDIRATTTPHELPVDSVSFNDMMIEFIGPDGAAFDDVGTASSQSCLPHEDRFPEWAMEPGQDHAGALVLDLPADTGTIVYTDPSGQVYEWNF